MAENIPYDLLWVLERKYREEGYPQFLDSLYRQIHTIIPHLPLGDVRDVLKDCPDDSREAMWQKWLTHNRVSHMSLQELNQATKGMSPDVLSLVWMQWASQVDLTQYTANQLDKVAKELPSPLVRQIVDVYKRQRGLT